MRKRDKMRLFPLGKAKVDMSEPVGTSPETLRVRKAAHQAKIRGGK